MGYGDYDDGGPAGPGVYGDEQPWEKLKRERTQQVRRSLNTLDNAGPGVFTENEKNEIRWKAHKAGIRDFFQE